MSDLEWGPVTEWCRVSLSADRSSSVAGEKITVTVVLRNVSDKPVQYEPYPFAPGIDYKVFAAEGESAEMTAYGRLLRDSAGVSSSAVETLAPGQDVVYELLLSRVYDLTVAKSYRAQVSRVIVSQGRSATASSNVLKLEVSERE